MLTQPRTYNEMLSQLNWVTAILTFAYTAVLTRFGFLPYIPIAKGLIPPVDIAGSKELVSWAAAAFGVVPVVCSIAAFGVSRAFEIHNIASKALQIRFLWDKYYIVKPLRSRANSDIPLDRKTVRKVMHEFYYGAVKGIDPHYVHIFWRYALSFWVIFEHVLVVAVSIVILLFLKATDISELIKYLLLVIAVGAVHFQFVATSKTRDQVRQIPTGAIEAYFRSIRTIARV